MGVAAAGETTSLLEESNGGATGSYNVHKPTHPGGISNQASTERDVICLWEVGEVTESGARAYQAALFPLRLLPHIQRHNTAMQIALRWQIPKAPAITM